MIFTIAVLFWLVCGWMTGASSIDRRGVWYEFWYALWLISAVLVAGYRALHLEMDGLSLIVAGLVMLVTLIVTWVQMGEKRA